MDYSIKFRFVTRTLSEDYRVYADGGSRLLSDRSEFEPLRQKGGIVPEEGPCAVLFEDGGMSFLVASALRRPSRDIAGRPIRFSFCQIFGTSGRERERARTAFDRITSDWAAAEAKAGSLLREIPRGEGASSLLGEDIRFDQDAFIRWLQDGDKRRVWPFSERLLPRRTVKRLPEGYMLRWTQRSGETECRPMTDSPAETGEKADAVHYKPHRSMIEKAGKKRRLIFFAAAVLVLLCCCVAGVRRWNRFQAERAVRLATEERAAARSARAAREITDELALNISGLIEWTERRMASFDGRPEDIAGPAKAAELLREAEKLLK